ARTPTLFPYTTLFRSQPCSIYHTSFYPGKTLGSIRKFAAVSILDGRFCLKSISVKVSNNIITVCRPENPLFLIVFINNLQLKKIWTFPHPMKIQSLCFLPRSEERRVGKECRSRWRGDQYKKKVDLGEEGSRGYGQ